VPRTRTRGFVPAAPYVGHRAAYPTAIVPPTQRSVRRRGIVPRTRTRPLVPAAPYVGHPAAHPTAILPPTPRLAGIESRPTVLGSLGGPRATDRVTRSAPHPVRNRSRVVPRAPRPSCRPLRGRLGRWQRTSAGAI